MTDKVVISDYTEADWRYLREMEKALATYRGDLPDPFYVSNMGAIVSEWRWP